MKRHGNGVVGIAAHAPHKAQFVSKLHRRSSLSRVLPRSFKQVKQFAGLAVLWQKALKLTQIAGFTRHFSLI